MLKRLKPAIVITVLFIPLLLSAETLFLKEGAPLEGKILSETDKAVTLQTPDGARREIARKNLLRTLYSDEHKHRVYIYRNDGTMAEGHIVDENDQVYTLRAALSDPREFQVKKSEIAFVARQQVKMADERIDPSMRCVVLEFRKTGPIPVEGVEMKLPSRIIAVMNSIEGPRAKEEPISFAELKKRKMELNGIRESETVGKIGSAFGADVVISGSIIKTEKGYIIQASAVRSSTGAVLSAASAGFTDIAEFDVKAEYVAYRLAGYNEKGYKNAMTSKRLDTGPWGFRLGILYDFNNSTLRYPLWIDWFQHGRSLEYDLSLRMNWSKPKNPNINYFDRIPLQATGLVTWFPWLQLGFTCGYTFWYGSIQVSHGSQIESMWEVQYLFHSIRYGFVFRGSENFRTGFLFGYGAATKTATYYYGLSSYITESKYFIFPRFDVSAPFELFAEYFFTESIGVKWVLQVGKIRNETKYKNEIELAELVTGLQVSRRFK